MSEGPNPNGLCQCGCGERTALAKQTRRDRGDVKGEPVRYVLGHKDGIGRRGYDVDPVTGCWNYRGHLSEKGYGFVRRGGGKIPVHQFYYEQVKGPVPAGEQLDHLCRNRGCVNPDHLEPVTGVENTRRGENAVLSEEQVREIRRRLGTETQTALAEEFGVSRSCIWDIDHGRSWRDVA